MNGEIGQALEKKEFTCDRNQTYSLYEALEKQKEQHGYLDESILTYDTLYQLSIEEGIIDSMIGDLFGLKKSQVCYRRRKYNLGNIFIKKSIDQFERRMEEKADLDPTLTSLSKTELYPMIYQSCKIMCEKNGWKVSTLDEYVRERMEVDTLYRSIMHEYLPDIELEYTVTINNSSH